MAPDPAHGGTERTPVSGGNWLGQGLGGAGKAGVLVAMFQGPSRSTAVPVPRKGRSPVQNPLSERECGGPEGQPCTWRATIQPSPGRSLGVFPQIKAG